MSGNGLVRPRLGRLWISAVLTISAAWLPRIACAGQGTWTSGGPNGGTVYALAIDPTTPSRLYAGTDRGGAFKSIDAGATWTAIDTGFTGRLYNYTVHALAINPATPTTLYAGTDVGVFKSTDAGGTWVTSLNKPAHALAIDASTTTTLYAGTFGLGVFRSTDSGNTWVAINTGLTNLVIQALAIHPTTPATIYAGTSSGGVFKSTNAGSTWAAVNVGLTRRDVLALAIDPSTPTTLYAGTNGGVFKSINSGGNWGAINVGLEFPTTFALSIDPTTPTTLYAGTQSGGVFRSTDSGSTWVSKGPANESVFALALNPASTSTLYAGASVPDYIGLFKSNDSADSWAVVNMGLTNLDVRAVAISSTTTTTLYTGIWGAGVYRSTDSGGTWTAVNTGLAELYVLALATDPRTSATVYAGTDSGAFRSTDAGGTWTTTSLNGSVYALAIDPSDPATIYAGTGVGAFKSTDSGSTWVSVNEGLGFSPVSALAVDPTAPTTLYAGTLGSGIFKSTDSGGTWVEVSAGLTDSYVHTLVITSAAPATIYAGTDSNGVFKSSNSGGSWVSTGLVNESVFALALNPTTPSTLYAGTNNQGVLKSTDSGGTWANTDLLNLPAQALALDPTGSTTLYAGLAFGSVWQFTGGSPFCTPPTAVASGSAAICDGSSASLNGSGGVSCSWSPATGLSDANSCSPAASPAVTTTYILTVTDAADCSSTNAPTVTVTVSNPIAVASGSATIPAGSSTLLSGSGGVACSWSPATGLSDPTSCSPLASPNTTTLYALIVTDENGCNSTNTATVLITVIHSPAGLARLVVGGDYQTGAKGWDWHVSSFVGAAAIKTSGYHWSFRDLSAVDNVLDCSGLVFWSYNTSSSAARYMDTVNPIYYEGADGQYRNNSVPVAESDLAPGDLLFFHFEGPPGLASHVAMYVGCCGPGGTDVVSASSPALGIGWRSKDAQKALPGFLGFGRVTPPRVGIVFTAHSPVTLSVTDPDGFTITPTTLLTTSEELLREIPGLLYYSEADPDAAGRPAATVYAPSLKAGFYLVHVAPRPDAASTDTYSLDVTAGGQTVILADSVMTQHIPPEGYGVASTGADISSFLPVTIDIKPGETPNSIQSSSNGKIPVAILSTPTFHAPARIEVASLTFGRSGNEPSRVSCSQEDSNRDGLTDLVCHFSTQAAQFRIGDSTGVLRGRTTDGKPVVGTDSVRIVH